MDRGPLILLEIDCLWPEQHLAEALPLLPPEIQARAARYLAPDSRRNLIATRTRLRQTLEALGLEQSSIRVADNGRPYQAEQNLQFNLSHSHQRAVLALSREPALREGLGVDLEWCGRSIDVVAIGRRFFTPDEHAWIGSQTGRFFHVWTRKEAVIKSNGVGLRVELDGFEVLSERVAAQVSGQPLWLGTLRRPENYTLSWAVALPDLPVEVLSDQQPDWLERIRQRL
jgi:4'-phosphopantetheinyl transferase